MVLCLVRYAEGARDPLGGPPLSADVLLRVLHCGRRGYRGEETAQGGGVGSASSHRALTRASEIAARRTNLLHGTFRNVPFGNA